VRELVERFGDHRITYVRNEENLGLAGNWNRCVELSKTPLVTLVHGDDELMPHYAATMLAAHSKWPDAAAIFCEATVIDERGREVFSFRDYVKGWLLPDPKNPFALEGEQGVRSLLRGNFIMCPTLCYKRTLFQNITFSPEWRMVLDVDFYFRAIAKGAKFVGLRDVAYRYRRHAEQITAECELNLRIFSEEVELWRCAARDARARGWHGTAKVAESMTIIKLQLLYYLLADVRKLQFDAAGKKLTFLTDIWLGTGRFK
jgi:GT2 family glycosyltransferase